MPERVADAYVAGEICNLDVMYGIDYFDYKDMPIDDVRQKLGIVAKANDIDSPGVWHPDGSRATNVNMAMLFVSASVEEVIHISNICSHCTE